MASSRISDLSPFIEKLTQDERWQAGLEEAERRLCIGFVVDALILAKNCGWDIERMYERALGAVVRFSGRESVDSRQSSVDSGRKEASGGAL